LIADEAIWAETKAVRGPLKNLITSEKQPIERKGVDMMRERLRSGSVCRQLTINTFRPTTRYPARM
jgi:hypothetical protein